MKKYKFTECVEVVGNACPVYEGEKLYISTGAVATDVIDETKVESVTYDEKPSRANLVVDENTLLFAKMQATKKIMLVDAVSKDYIYSTGFCAVKPIETIISHKCLYHLLMSDMFLKQKDKNCSGATQKAITNAGLDKICISVPALEKQDAISRKLDLISELMKNQRKGLEKLDDLIKSRFVEMFGNPIENDKKWNECSAAEICHLITDGSHFSPQGAETGYPMLSVKDMRNDGFHYEKCKLVNQTDYEVLLKQGCKPLKDDVLIAKDGSYFYYGFVLREEIEQAVLSSVAILRPNKNIVNPQYLCNYMLSEQTVKLVTDNYVTGAALKRVILKGIKQIPVMLPPIERQNEFATFVNQVTKLKFEIQQSLDNLQLLYNSLMQKYFG